jgi:hypothetical protein
MATRYQQGRDTEYKAQEDLAAMGYESMRAASSKGAADVIGWCPSAIRYIQCKRYTDRPGTFTKDLAQLQSMKLPPNASAELWLRQGGRAGWVERVLIQHTFPVNMDLSDLDDLGRQERFVQPINPDPVTDLSKRLSASAKALRCKTTPARKTIRPAQTSAQSLAAQSSTTSPTTATRPASGTEAPPSELDPATPV